MVATSQEFSQLQKLKSYSHCELDSIRSLLNSKLYVFIYVLVNSPICTITFNIFSCLDVQCCRGLSIEKVVTSFLKIHCVTSDPSSISLVLVINTTDQEEVGVNKFLLISAQYIHLQSYLERFNLYFRQCSITACPLSTLQKLVHKKRKEWNEK